MYDKPENPVLVELRMRRPDKGFQQGAPLPTEHLLPPRQVYSNPSSLAALLAVVIGQLSARTMQTHVKVNRDFRLEVSGVQRADFELMDNCIMAALDTLASIQLIKPVPVKITLAFKQKGHTTGSVVYPLSFTDGALENMFY